MCIVEDNARHCEQFGCVNVMEGWENVQTLSLPFPPLPLSPCLKLCMRETESKIIAGIYVYLKDHEVSIFRTSVSLQKILGEVFMEFSSRHAA